MGRVLMRPSGGGGDLSSVVSDLNLTALVENVLTSKTFVGKNGIKETGNIPNNAGTVKAVSHVRKDPGSTERMNIAVDKGYYECSWDNNSYEYLDPSKATNVTVKTSAGSGTVTRSVYPYYYKTINIDQTEAFNAGKVEGTTGLTLFRRWDRKDLYPNDETVRAWTSGFVVRKGDLVVVLVCDDTHGPTGFSIGHHNPEVTDYVAPKRVKLINNEISSGNSGWSAMGRIGAFVMTESGTFRIKYTGDANTVKIFGWQFRP